ncbi:MAG: 50S ribosomal protein L29 [Bacteroidia bacterium]|nr:50S ribosomal protein L29 [Bacteroidia bacterium]MCZ2247745.1 50S ribosomal protein L29 [Bacteroidia bacterium]
MLKQSTIKQFSNEELNERLSVEIAALSKMKINHAISPLENPLSIKVTRRDIARLKTEINNRKNTK